MLTSRYKTAFTRSFTPFARVLVQLKISPTTITLLGLVFMVASCLFVLLTKRVVMFCVLVTASGLFDALDGAVARLSGRVTKFGAYLDAMCDRYVEGIVVLTVAAITGYWVLSGWLLLGAMLVSYAKARAAMEVSVTNQEWPDLMERTERSAIFLVGLLMSRLIGWSPLGRDLFWWTLLLLGALVHATLIQRILRAKHFIARRER